MCDCRCGRRHDFAIQEVQAVTTLLLYLFYSTMDVPQLGYAIMSIVDVLI